MSGEIARQVVESFRRKAPSTNPARDQLTPREEEVLSMLAKGLCHERNRRYPHAVCRDGPISSEARLREAACSFRARKPCSGYLQ